MDVQAHVGRVHQRAGVVGNDDGRPVEAQMLAPQHEAAAVKNRRAGPRGESEQGINQP